MSKIKQEVIFMIQATMELLFDAAYLTFALFIGIYLIVKGKGKIF